MSFNRARLLSEAVELRTSACKDAPLSEVLIRCKTIARLLNDSEMIEWIDHETTGTEGSYYFADKNKRKRLSDLSPYRNVETTRSFADLHSPNRGEDLQWDNIRKLLARFDEYYFTTSPIAVLEANRQNGFEVSVPKEILDDFMAPIKKELDGDSSVLLRSMRLLITSTNILSIINGVRVKLIDYLDGIVRDQPLNIVDIFYESMNRTYDKVRGLYPDLMGEFEAIHMNIIQKKSEGNSNVASACRRILKKFADMERPSGKETTLDGHRLTDADYMNRIKQWIKEKTKGTSEAEVIKKHFDYIDEIYGLGSKGDKNPITDYEAQLCSIHTYFAIAEFIRIKELASPNISK